MAGVKNQLLHHLKAYNHNVLKHFLVMKKPVAMAF